VGDWYLIGLCVGLGVGIGILLAGVLGASRLGRLAAVGLAAACGAGAGFLVQNYDEAIGGAVGGLAGALGAAVAAGGTLRRGGTRGGTAALFAGAGVVAAALALIPIVGYLEAVALPALAVRMRRRGGERYAGLRILARD